MSGAADPAEPASGDAGTVYLIHLDTPYKHARHYTGWTRDLDARLEAHRHGYGARLMEVIKDAGISWRLARTWPGGRDRERAIKDRHEAPRLCPKCTPQPRPVGAGRSATVDPGHHAAVRQAPGQQPSPEPESAHESEYGTEPWAWPGIPDEAAIQDRYRVHWEVVDNLISGWRQAQVSQAELDGAEAEAG